MRVEVRLFATLAGSSSETRAGEARSVEVEEGATLRDLIEWLGIAPESVHLAIVNGRAAPDRSTHLAECDRVGLFPPVGGG